MTRLLDPAWISQDDSPQIVQLQRWTRARRRFLMTGSRGGEPEGCRTRWTDPSSPGNGIRIDQGTPGVRGASQQVDHVVVRIGGRILGPDGKPIVGSLADNRLIRIQGVAAA